MYRLIIMLLICLAGAGCTYGKSVVLPVNPQTRQLQTDERVAAATTVVAKHISFVEFSKAVLIFDDDFSPLNARFVPDNVAQMKALGVFGQVLSPADLPGIVEQHHLQDQVPSFRTWGDLGRLYRAWQPYLVVHFKCLDRGDIVYSMIVTNPDTLEDVFVSEIVVHSQLEYGTKSLLTLGSGMSTANMCTDYDARTRYPLFNAFLRWIDQKAR